MNKLLFVCAFVIAGCATTEKYENAVKAWVGRSSDDLVAEQGPPASTFKMNNGNTVFVYRRDGGVQYSDVLGGVQANPITCQTEFSVNQKGIIETYSFRGNDCVAE